MEDAGILVNAINILLSSLPETWKPTVRAGLQLMSALSIMLMVLRPVLARLFPRFSGSAPVVMVDRVLNFLAGNSRRLEVRPSVLKARVSNPTSKR